eukprot:scaffold398_cov177-Ochromonas_danica.AAC.31
MESFAKSQSRRHQQSKVGSWLFALMDDDTVIENPNTKILVALFLLRSRYVCWYCKMENKNPNVSLPVYAMVGQHPNIQS